MYTFIRLSVTPELRWSDLDIELGDGSNYSAWKPSTLALTSASGNQVTEDLGGQSVGSINVSCEATDLEGNGVVDRGDYLVFKAPFLQGATTYRVELWCYLATGDSGSLYIIYSDAL